MRNTCVLVLAATLFSGASAFAQTAQPAASALKIVVVKGEDAVNIIQQKTAVAPIVEVRDRNNLPVPGATVTFSLTGQGGAFAGGAQSLTVVTNAAGQATAAGLTPTAAGAVNISATATFQGQMAVATITQTNVMTAAEVAGTTTTAGGGGAAGGGGSATGTGNGAAGGGGGGISGSTVGIIGGVVGVAGLVGVKAAGGGDDSPSTTSTSPTNTPPSTSTPTTTTTTPPTSTTPPTTTPAPTTPAPTPAPTSSSFSGPMDGTYSGTSSVTVSGVSALTCTFSMRMTGTSSIRTSGTTGTLTMSGRETVTTNSCGEAAGLLADEPFTWSAPVEVSGSTVRFTQEFRDSGSVPGGSYTSVATTSFTGTLSAMGLTGTLTMTSVVDVRGDGFTSHAQWTGSMQLSMR